MSTLPGVASKGEKAKPKFQSLDINNLYRVSRGENLEKQQQKTTFTYKHGMQSLGKVPNARRAPANLPSLKSEHSGTDASVPLVPPGGPGWGKQESTSSTSTTPSTTTTTAPNSTLNSQPQQPSTNPPQLSAHQAAIALPVTNPVIPPPSNKQPASATGGITPTSADNKSWSAVMSGPDPGVVPVAPMYQNPQFQHEFPSLNVGDGGPTTLTGQDAPYAPGLSLRPQTEGSWIQGGSRSGTDGPPRSSSVPLGAPPQLAVQVGLQQTLPPQFRGVLPNFMYKGSFAASGTGTSQNPAPMNGRSSRSDNRPPPRLVDPEEITPRPIIKEEELSRMDEIDRDLGWTCHDDIDYNQKLAFSDDESTEKTTKREPKTATTSNVTSITTNTTTGVNGPQVKDNDKNETHESQRSNWNSNLTTNRQRSSEEELWKQRRQQHNKDLELTVQRAKQRKEEEEKRFNEATKQGAAKKLMELEEKMNKRREEENVGTINPSIVPPKPIVPADIPLPDFQRDKDSGDEKSSFRQLTQIEGKNFSTSSSSSTRKHLKNEQNGPNFPRHYQSQLPPRFQKQRNNSSGSSHYNNWMQKRQDSPGQVGELLGDHDDVKDYKRQPSDHDDYDFKEKKDDWHNDRRPQRPDSRDSRTSRDSRQSEPRDHIGSWAESVFEPTYEEKRREKERQVPGPITKERLQEDDLKSEKRGLTQLKKGQIPEKKVVEEKDEKANDDQNNSKVWSDTIPTKSSELELVKVDPPKKEESKKTDSEMKEKEDKRNKNRTYGSNKGWSGDYNRQSWPKRQPRGFRSGKEGGHGTDSEGSMDDANADKTVKKMERDEKLSTFERNKDKQEAPKRENYVPRGEPSRHGRGGGNFRSRGGLSKRIDGYGPPPSKSPFSHLEDKEKKVTSEETVINENLSSEDKAKQNQQALAAGIIGNARKEQLKIDDKGKSRKMDTRRGKSKSKNEENFDTNSDNSEEKKKRGTSVGQNRRNNAPPRLVPGEKKPYPKSDNPVPRQNSSGALRSQSAIKKDEQNNVVVDAAFKKNDTETEETEEKGSQQADSDGFQEVKSKKTVKKTEEKPNKSNKIEKDGVKVERKPKGATSQLTQQQISNIPPLMATPVNPPPVLPQTNKNQFERPRQSKLAPRFAKQRENNRLQKAQLQHQGGLCGDVVNDMNKVNQNLNVYGGGIKEGGVVSPLPNAWDKTLGSQIRIEADSSGVLGVGDGGVQGTGQSQSPSGDKIIGKGSQLQDKTILDGTTPPVTTIIFENTNFKSAPGARNSTRSDKPRSKLEESMESSVVSSFNKPISDLLCKNDKQTDSIQIPLPFKEDNADIKLDFFDPELLTEEKTSKNLCMPRSMSGNTISTADALNFKIQSVKKMWDAPSDHVGQEDNSSTFSSSFDPNTLDPNAFGKGNDTPDDNHDGYSPSPNQVAANNTTNVCKVKPTQQVAGGGQSVLNSASHQQHSSGIIGPSSLMGNPLSPPPLQPVIGTGVNLGQPPQQYTANQHISYQASLGANSQYGISAIPSPPTVMYNSTQSLQQSGLYAPFQIDHQTGVLGGQGRSQYSQYPNHYGLGQTASSPYSTQSVYLQTQPHPPPPTAQAPPDLYQNYRLSAATAGGPYGQSQQLNNPTTVLISSTSTNSLMSASVKPSGQQISAIGTKAGGVGQAYQQQSQQSQQVYMAYEPALPANYLPSAMQRAPTGPPVQNSVVPGLQPSSSYYSGSTGQTGYFQQPGSSTIQSAQLQQHQAGYGNVFGTHGQSHHSSAAAASLQSFNSHFLSTPMLAAAISAQQQQFRSGLTPAQFMKGVAGGAGSEQGGGGRSQQLKSPGSQEVLSSVFNSAGSQISSPKLRQNCKQPPPQPSPTAQHKYNLYQSMGNQQSGNMQRYPPPIQRPVNFQQNLGSSQQNPNQKHRPNNSNKAPSRQFYQNNSISSQNEKLDDGKLAENALNSSTSPSVNSSVATKIGTSSASTVNASSDITKDTINIEETATLKD